MIDKCIQNKEYLPSLVIKSKNYLERERERERSASQLELIIYKKGKGDCRKRKLLNFLLSVLLFI